MSLRHLIVAALLKASLASAATAQSFQPPSISPFHQSLNYTGQSNGSLPISDVTPGLVFDRFVQVWFENTDFATANSTAEFRALAVPEELRGTVDTTYYTHYSAMSSVQANWGLGSLGRGDTDPIMSNVYSLVADASGYKNNNVSGDAIPATNVHGTIPGPLNTNYPTDWPAPNTSAVGAGGGPVFVG